MHRLHRVTWSSDTQPGQTHNATWMGHDGLVPLPTAGRHERAGRAVVLCGRWAAVVTGERLVELEAGRPTRDGDMQLRWEPAAQPLQPLGPQPTQSERPRTQRRALRLVDATGHELRLAQTPLVVGRSRACHWTVDEASVSALHCVLQRHAGGLRIIDLGSTNGTWLDGARIHDAFISGRGRLQLGSARLFVAPPPSPDLIPLPSAAMQSLEQLLLRLADSRAPVHIRGESGVGKEGVARRVHALSGRDGPFIPLNAAVLSKTLAASELFGHRAGAFTGADQDRRGAFLAADGGTLFLDEIAELPLDVQAELLRTVESHTVRRLGENEAKQVDVRLVTATNADLHACVRAGTFRADLLHRICVLPVEVPALRERPEDLDAIVRAVLQAETPPRRLGRSAWRRLRAHPWPGNVRELLNVLHRAVVMSDRTTLEADDLCLSPPPRTPTGRSDMLIREAILETYQRSGNVAQTAQCLGLHRATVYRHLRQARAAERGR